MVQAEMGKYRDGVYQVEGSCGKARGRNGAVGAIVGAGAILPAPGDGFGVHVAAAEVDFREPRRQPTRGTARAAAEIQHLAEIVQRYAYSGEIFLQMLGCSFAHREKNSEAGSFTNAKSKHR